MKHNEVTYHSNDMEAAFERTYGIVRIETRYADTLVAEIPVSALLRSETALATLFDAVS